MKTFFCKNIFKIFILLAFSTVASMGLAQTNPNTNMNPTPSPYPTPTPYPVPNTPPNQVPTPAPTVTTPSPITTPNRVMTPTTPFPQTPQDTIFSNPDQEGNLRLRTDTVTMGIDTVPH